MVAQPTDFRRGRPAPSDNNFELFAWFFMRISGVALMFLAVGHMVIMHIINSIDVIDYWFVAERWSTPFWRIYDALLLILALLHGFNGLRIIIDDYLRPGGLRTLALSVLYLTGFVFTVIGLMVIVTFQPQ